MSAYTPEEGNEEAEVFCNELLDDLRKEPIPGPRVVALLVDYLNGALCCEELGAEELTTCYELARDAAAEFRELRTKLAAYEPIVRAAVEFDRATGVVVGTVDGEEVCEADVADLDLARAKLYAAVRNCPREFLGE